jgi:hypothetical protein
MDRGIDRKVRILLRLRKDAADLPVAPAGQDDGARMEDLEEALENDISSSAPQAVEAAESSKMSERTGNVIENKGPAFGETVPTGNVTENKGSYAQNAGMSLKTKGVIGNIELHATGKWRTTLPGSDHGLLLR